MAGTMSLYADDMMLYCQINSHANYVALQDDVNRLCVWSDKNFLKFNATKCKFMIISRKHSPTLPFFPLLSTALP